MRTIRSLIIAWIVWIALVVPAAAQSSVAFDRMEIEIWPEYDRAAALVIYRITLSADVALPAQLSLRIPKAAQSPYSLAWQDVDGSLYNLSYTDQIQGDWLVITFTTQAADFQLEYYDPRLTKDGTLRMYSYQWGGDYAVNDLTISVQQPRTAEPMEISPSLGAGSLQSDGLIYYSKDIGSVSAGTPFKIGFQYEKNDDKLSASNQPVQSADIATPAGVDLEGVLPWIIVAITAILFISAVMWYFLTRQHAVSNLTQHRRRRGGGKKADAASTIVEEDGVHCHRCGKKAGSGDIFCRTCGTKLRRD